MANLKVANGRPIASAAKEKGRTAFRIVNPETQGARREENVPQRPEV